MPKWLKTNYDDKCERIEMKKNVLADHPVAMQGGSRILRRHPYLHVHRTISRRLHSTSQYILYGSHIFSPVSHVHCVNM
jgi:hypothetical protein